LCAAARLDTVEVQSHILTSQELSYTLNECARIELITNPTHFIVEPRYNNLTKSVQKFRK